MMENTTIKSKKGGPGELKGYIRFDKTRDDASKYIVWKVDGVR